MRKHLTGCIEEYRYEVIGRDDREPIPGYHLAIQAERAPVYWLHLLARADAQLSHLDSFLRDAWMEDRSTHSRFVVGTSVYSSRAPTSASPSSLQSDMSIELREVLENDVEFEYAYDLEATTELEGRAIDQRNILPDQRETPVRLIARNEPPEIPCTCGSSAEFFCPNCAEGPEGWLCSDCADEHACFGGSIERSPIQNTPRALRQV